jgi:hypothetical protein
MDNLFDSGPKAEALEIDIFYADTRPLKGDAIFTLQPRLVAATWVIERLAFLKA